VEYCFVEWQNGNGFPAISHYDQVGACATTASGRNVDNVFTAFHAGLTYSTERSGSADTFRFTAGSFYQAASISVQNLRNAINAVNAPVSAGGCNRGDSTNVGNYALIGYEHGIEGGNLSVLGESVSSERIYTTTDSFVSGRHPLVRTNNNLIN